MLCFNTMQKIRGSERVRKPNTAVVIPPTKTISAKIPKEWRNICSSKITGYTVIPVTCARSQWILLRNEVLVSYVPSSSAGQPIVLVFDLCQPPHPHSFHGYCHHDNWTADKFTASINDSIQKLNIQFNLFTGLVIIIVMCNHKKKILCIYSGVLIAVSLLTFDPHPMDDHP